jgi:hypothetical protein
MVFEHLQDLFDLEDSTNNFLKLFLMYSYVVIGRIPKNITKALGVVKLLALVKPCGGIWPIAIDETFYQMVNRTFCHQFHDAFSIHLFPHQFGVAIMGGYEVVMHGIRVALDVHPNWVVL